MISWWLTLVVGVVLEKMDWENEVVFSLKTVKNDDLESPYILMVIFFFLPIKFLNIDTSSY